MEINGVAHTFITAGDFAASRAFYAQLCRSSVSPSWPIRSTPSIASAAAPVSAFMPLRRKYAGQKFRQGSVGLHHHCFRARERADIDAAHEFLKKIGARIVHAPQQDEFAPGYYSVLFEDPDGVRLEINHVPGKGLLGDDRPKIGGGYGDGTQNG